mmetsp:Transcript_21409/g.49327  ORF Transcript_21409/g.49327 Transcript_21409/m.49327 type:complete len:296 (-) Transcript_21409:129-1016(-)
MPVSAKSLTPNARGGGLLGRRLRREHVLERAASSVGLELLHEVTVGRRHRPALLYVRERVWEADARTPFRRPSGLARRRTLRPIGLVLRPYPQMGPRQHVRQHDRGAPRLALRAVDQRAPRALALAFAAPCGVDELHRSRQVLHRQLLIQVVHPLHLQKGHAPLSGAPFALQVLGAKHVEPLRCVHDERAGVHHSLLHHRRVAAEVKRTHAVGPDVELALARVLRVRRLHLRHALHLVRRWPIGDDGARCLARFRPVLERPADVLVGRDRLGGVAGDVGHARGALVRLEEVRLEA